MRASLAPSPDIPTLGALLERLGGVAPGRVRYYPMPGTATPSDVLAIDAREDRLCELVDGVLVEKAMGFRESLLAAVLATVLNTFARAQKLGIVTGANGAIELLPDLVRIPDVTFVSWARLPGGRVPPEPIPRLVPDLAVEVLSAGNTVAEIDRKCREYFEAGVQLVWLVDAEARRVTVLTGSEQRSELIGDATLSGGAVLPGFALRLPELFAELDTLYWPRRVPPISAAR